MVLFITGLPGVGKSYWGNIWAEESGLPFIDLDYYIALTTGKSPAEIILQEGEPSFRKTESSALKNLFQQLHDSAIIATGGGTVTHPESLQLIKNNGFLLLLKAPLGDIAERLKNDVAERPLLTNLDTLWQARKAAYNKADATVWVKDLSSQSIYQFL